jgi:hypothetical protein
LWRRVCESLRLVETGLIVLTKISKETNSDFKKAPKRKGAMPCLKG